MFFDIASTPDRDKQALLAFALTKASEPVAPVDDFVLHRTTRPYELLSDEELIAAPAGSVAIVDMEAFINYTLISFKIGEKVLIFEQDADEHIIGCGGSRGICDEMCSGLGDCLQGVTIERRKLLYVMEKFLTVGFNSIAFDLLLIQMAIKGAGPAELKSIANEIIQYDGRPHQIRQRLGFEPPKWNHIDLIAVCPLKGSLKLYAGRLHCQTIQDLPFEHEAVLSPDEVQALKAYNINDLDNTELLLDHLKPQLDLRYAMSNQYNVDVRSKSDAQIAEAVINSELFKLKGYRSKYPEIAPGTEYRYKTPKFIRYQTPLFQNMLDVVQRSRFIVNDTGSVDMPEAIGALDLTFGACKYQMGIGGLHSTESCTAHLADENTLLIDRDVVSYYPAIILNTELYPHHLGKDFLKVYRGLVESRIADKKAGNKVGADAKKIVVNGSFGKLGSMYSALYAPDLLIQVTLTGQLSLLILIEMLELAGIPVVSANTDGVLAKFPSSLESTYFSIISQWEIQTGFQTEETRYKAVYMKDVNNYIAISE